MPVESRDAGQVHAAKSKIVKGKNGETTVTTDCSGTQRSQIRTANFNFKEGEKYKVSSDLKA